LCHQQTLDVVLVASGSEVGETLKAAKALAPLKVRVVSMPSTSLFDEQSVEYRRSVLPVGVPIISVEAGSVLGWERYSHASIGMTTFGLSGPYEKVLAHFNFLGDGIAERVKHHLSVLAQLGKVGPVATHFDFGYAKHTAHH
jgi:transketolase